MSGVLLRAGVCLLVLNAAGQAAAAIYTWDGGQGDGIWQTGASVTNWDPDAYAPGDNGGNNFVFTGSGAGGPSTISLEGGHNPDVNNLLLNGNTTPLTFTIANTSGTHLDLVPLSDDYETVTVAAGTYTINGTGSSDGAVQLLGGSGTGLQTFNVYSSASLAINARITDNGYAFGVIKAGSGTLTLTATHTYGGSTIVSNGVMTYSGSGGSSGTTATNLVVGGAAGKGVLNMNSSGTLSFGTATASSSYIGGTASGTSDTGVGAVNQSSGTVGLGTGTGCYLWLGAGGSSAYGSYNLSGGTLNTSGIQVGLKGYGSYVQSAGYMNANSWRYFVVAGDTNSAGVATFTGGTVNVPRWSTVGAASNAIAALNIGTLAGGTVTYTNGVSSANSYGLILGDNGATGVLNLNSGTLVLGAYSIRGRINGPTGTGILNLNGGTIKANTTSTLIDTTLTSVNVFKGGVTFDTQANTSTVSANLLAAAGNGIYPTGGTLAVASGGGSGYIGPPLVTVSGGSGSGAMAIANVSGGVVTGVTLTCPGQNYQAGDNLSFAFAGGGYDSAASAFNYTLQAGDVAANGAGALTKTGAGTLTLSGTNSYSGDTFVQSGALTVSGKLTGAGTCRALSEGTLQGTGTVNNVEVQAGGILSPGISGAGTLTITGSLAVGGGTLAFDVAQNQAGSGTNDLLDVGGALDVSGVSTIAVHVTAFPPVQQVTVAQFSSLTGSGEFAVSGLPPTIIGTLATNATSLVLNLELAPQDLTWTGGNGATWDVGSTTNWMIDAADDALFYNLDRVTFDDTGAANNAVTVNGTVQPGSVTVDSASHYTFNGPGGMGGIGGLTKAGIGTLTLTAANPYTGATTINGGAMVLGGGGALSGSALITVGSNAALRLSGSVNNQIQLSAANPSLTICGALDATTTNAHTLYCMNTVLHNGRMVSSGGGNTTWGSFYVGVNRTITATGPSNHIEGTANTIAIVNGAVLTLDAPSAGDALTVSGSIANRSGHTTGALTKTGAGTLTLTGANTYGGVTTVSDGVMTYSGTGASSGTTNSSLLVGGAAGKGVLNMNSSGALSFATVSAGNVYIGGNASATDTGAGAFNQTAGTVNATRAAVYISLGEGGPTSYGSCNVSGGTLNTGGFRIGHGGLGSYVQSGGYMNTSLGRFFAVGEAFAAPTGCTNGIGVATFTGGTASIISANWTVLGDGAATTGILNIGTEAGGSATFTNLNATGITVGAGGSGSLNLNSGTIVLGGPINKSGGSGILSLNGGTLRAGGNITLINTTLDSVSVFRGGVTFDSQGYNATVSANLPAAAGSGIYPAGGALNVSSGGGSGYIGAPLVTVSGGSGSGAMAIAEVSGGAVTSVTLTCPGQNYQAGDNLNFAYAGGGYVSAASPFNYTLQAGDMAANATGGVTKVGGGTLTLGGTDSYGGDTIVQSGALAVNGRYTGTGKHRVLAGGTLQGMGTVNRAEVQAGGILSPGAGGVGKLSVAGNLAVSGGTIACDVAQNLDGTGTNDLLEVGGTLDMTGVNTIAVNVAVFPFAEEVTLIRFSSLTGAGSFALAGLSDRIVAALTTNATSLGLTMTSRSRNLAWTGGNGAAWDVAGTANWMIAAPDDSIFYEYDTVTFGDDGVANSNVTITGTVRPGAVTMNSAGSYTFNGPGGIGGVGGLSKAGIGTLTLTCTNSYTGPTVVSNGVLRVNGANSSAGLLSGTPVITVCSNSTLELAAGDALGWTAGKEALVIQSGALVSNTVANKRVSLASTVTMTGGTLAAAGDGDSNGAYSFNSSGVAATSDSAGNPARITARCSPQTTSATMNVTRGPALPESDMIISGALIPYSTSTHGIVKTGDGVLTLGGSNSYSGGTTISAGKLCVSSNENLGAAAGTVTLDGGTLRSMGSLSWLTRPFVVNAGTSYFEVDAGMFTHGSSTFSGSGTLIKTGAGRLQFESTGAGWAGALRIDQGIVQVTSSRLGSLTGIVVNPGGQYLIRDDGVATYDFNGVLTLSGSGPDSSGALLYNTQGTPAPSTGTINRPVVLAGDSVISVMSSGTNAYNLKLTGTISGDGGLTKTGSGMLTLWGVNAYSGATSVQGGTMFVAIAGSITGSRTVNVSGSSTLWLTKSGGLDSGTVLAISGDSAVVRLEKGVDQPIRSARIGLTQLRRGTWGSSASPAENQDDVHFAGEGMLTLSEGYHEGVVLEIR